MQNTLEFKRKFTDIPLLITDNAYVKMKSIKRSYSEILMFVTRTNDLLYQIVSPNESRYFTVSLHISVNF